MAWLLPELDVGEEPELRPLELELLELLELEEEEPELEDEPELVEPEPEEPEFELDDPEFVEEEPVEDDPVDVDDELVVCVDPGRARASAPAVTTLAMVTAVVVDRTLLRPSSLAVMARWIPSRGLLLICPILRSWVRESLHEPSG